MFRAFSANKEVRQILLFAGIVFLLFFRAKTALFVYGIEDDHCYVEWLFRFMGEVYEGCLYDHHYPGVVGLWLPAGLLAKFFSLVTPYTLIQTVPPLIGVTSFVLWVVSLIVMYRLMVQTFPTTTVVGKKPALWAIIFSLNVPVIYYAFVRTTLSHSVEWLLALCFLLNLQKKNFGWGLFFALWLGATRINDVFVFGILLVKYLESGAFRHFSARGYLRKGLLGVGVSLALASGVVALYQVFVSGYGKTSFLPAIVGSVSADDLYRVLFGVGGLVGTHTTWLVFLLFGTACVSRLSWTARSGLCWLWLLFLVCAGWGTAGGSFGYRYLIGSYIAIWLIWVELDTALSPRFSRFFRYALVFSAIVMSFYAWVFWTRFYMSPWVIQDWWWKIPGSASLVVLGPIGALGASILYPLTGWPWLEPLKLQGFPLWVLGTMCLIIFGLLIGFLKTWIHENKRQSRTFSGLATEADYA